MEKDIGRVPKNNDTDIVVRIDDFGGKIGLTIREFVKSERFTGFTKAGTRIPAEKFLEFREIINSITLEDIKALEASAAQAPSKAEAKPKAEKAADAAVEDY